MGYSPPALASWIRRTGGVPSPFGGDPVSHMLHLERDEPEIAAAARWYLEPVDYLTMRFTGRAAATHASMSGAWLTDNRHLDRLEYDARLIRRARLEPEKLPPLVETGSLVGTVLPEVAAEIGIDPGAQVVTGTPDPQEDRSSPLDRDGPRARLEQLSGCQQPRGGGSVPALAAR
jgi:xylulokinase